MMRAAILRIKDLKKSYNGFSLDIPQLEFQEGKIYGLTGPNGSGKTTFLSLLNLIEPPDSGVIYYKEERIPKSSTRSILTRRKMVMVLENPYLFQMSVLKNITYGLRFRLRDRKEMERRADEALRMVNLQGFGCRKAHELSRGETQRVAIARAIILEPEILLLDEPFTNIDKTQVGVIEELITDLNRKNNITIIFTTHDLFQAYRLSDTVFSFVNGKVLEGSVENLFSGIIKRNKKGQRVEIDSTLAIAVSTKMKGKVHVVIPPNDIILSKKPFQSSARNVLKGIIQKIEIKDNIVRVSCDTGIEFIALITKTSFDKMNLSIGSNVFLTFKTTAVKVF